MNPLFHHSAIPLFRFSLGLALSPKSFSTNCILRIYRFDENNPRHLVGAVEEVGIKGKKAFTNYDELWERLLSSKNIRQKQKKKGVRKRRRQKVFFLPWGGV